MTTQREQRDRAGSHDGGGGAGGAGDRHWQHRGEAALDADHHHRWCDERLVQMMAAPIGASAGPGAIHEAAERGVATPSTTLPHLDRIQESFGPHDVSQVQAHVGGGAADACDAIGASAFASGGHVAFAGAPDLHTAAHEAAHVVQQAQGVQLYGGVGAEGDAYERHADEVADRVVAGASAADLLGAVSAPARGGGAPVQRKQIALPGAGMFEDRKYEADNDPTTSLSGQPYKETGARIDVRFVPDPTLDADEVSLVQIVRSGVIDQQNPQQPDQASNMLGLRQIDDGSDDDGFAIDQEVHKKHGTATVTPWPAEMTALIDELDAHATVAGIPAVQDVVRTKTGRNVTRALLDRHAKVLLARNDVTQIADLVRILTAIRDLIPKMRKKLNLDPRYSEERQSETEPLTPALTNDKPGDGLFGWTAVRAGGVWSPGVCAALRDNPNTKHDPTHQLTGAKEFETTAMATRGSEKWYLGSIRWGYHVTGLNTSVLAPTEIEHASDGATPTFLKAAKKWNEMRVPDPIQPGVGHAPIALPQHDDTPEERAEVAAVLSDRLKDGDVVRTLLEALGARRIRDELGAAILARVAEGAIAAGQPIGRVVAIALDEPDVYAQLRALANRGLRDVTGWFKRTSD